jgi:hypothetical protein
MNSKESPVILWNSTFSVAHFCVTFSLVSCADERRHDKKIANREIKDLKVIKMYIFCNSNLILKTGFL